jgi:hypothetical protein
VLLEFPGLPLVDTGRSNSVPKVWNSLQKKWKLLKTLRCLTSHTEHAVTSRTLPIQCAINNILAGTCERRNVSGKKVKWGRLQGVLVDMAWSPYALDGGKIRLAPFRFTIGWDTLC